MSDHQLFAITQLIIYHQNQKPTKKNQKRLQELKQQRRDLERAKHEKSKLETVKL